MDVRLDEPDSPRLRLSAPQGTPDIEADDELRCAQQDSGSARLAKLHAAEYRLGSVPAPAKRELAEADVETRLSAHDFLESSAVLRDLRQSKLIGKSDPGEERSRTQRG